jgi:hypothetical protein
MYEDLSLTSRKVIHFLTLQCAVYGVAFSSLEYVLALFLVARIFFQFIQS